MVIASECRFSGKIYFCKSMSVKELIGNPSMLYEVSKGL